MTQPYNIINVHHNNHWDHTYISLYFPHSDFHPPQSGIVHSSFNYAHEFMQTPGKLAWRNEHMYYYPLRPLWRQRWIWLVNRSVPCSFCSVTHFNINVVKPKIFVGYSMLFTSIVKLRIIIRGWASVHPNQALWSRVGPPVDFVETMMKYVLSVDGDNN